MTYPSEMFKIPLFIEVQKDLHILSDQHLSCVWLDVFNCYHKPGTGTLVHVLATVYVIW